MDTNEISFEKLFKVVTYLVSEVASIKTLVEKQMPAVTQRCVSVGIVSIQKFFFSKKRI